MYIGCFRESSHFFTRNNIAGKFAEFNPNLVNTLKKLNLWEQISYDILLAAGSVQEIAQIPQPVKEVYKSAFELDQKQVIAVAAIAQKYIDQGISRNLYFDTKNLDELTEVYIFYRSRKTGFLTLAWPHCLMQIFQGGKK